MGTRNAIEGDQAPRKMKAEGGGFDPAKLCSAPSTAHKTVVPAKTRAAFQNAERPRVDLPSNRTTPGVFYLCGRAAQLPALHFRRGHITHSFPAYLCLDRSKVSGRYFDFTGRSRKANVRRRRRLRKRCVSAA